MRLRAVFVLVVSVTVPRAFASPLFAIPGAASSFPLLGGTVIASGTASSIQGNVGATTTITGFDVSDATATGFVCTEGGAAPCTGGNDAAVTAAFNSIYTPVTGAFSVGEDLVPTGSFTTATSQTFAGNTVYASTGAISTTASTNLIFDAGGDSSAVFVIQVLGPLTVNGPMTFTLENGAQADNIFWIVEGAATISVASSGPITFDGNILAGSSFTMAAATGGAGVLAGTINGSVFADTANTLAGTTDVNGSSNPVPEPASAGLVSLGCLVAFLARRRAGGFTAS
jgi:hypothetical protein